MALCRRIKLTGIQYDRGEIMKNSKATASNLTEQDIKELQNYLAAMNDLYEQEPEEIWDDFFKDMQDKPEMPLKYCDRVRVVKATLTHDYINGKYQRLDKPRTVDTYVDIVHEKWENKLIATSQKYNDVINKAIIYAEQQHLSAPPKIHDIVKACIRDYNKLKQDGNGDFANIVSGNGLFEINRLYSSNITEEHRKLAVIQERTEKQPEITKTVIFKEDPKKDELVTYIKDYEDHKITVSVHILLDIIELKFTESKGEKTIHLSLSEYMKIRKLSSNSISKVRQQLQNDLETLHNTSIKFTDKLIKKHDLPRKTMDFIQGVPALTDENGKLVRKKTDDIEILLSDDFYTYLYLLYTHNQIEKYPLFLLSVDAYKEKYVYSIGKYISELERTQAGQLSQGVLTVRKILEQCGFPTIEQAKEKKNFKGLIIKPFFDALENLKDKYGYLKSYIFKDKKGHNADKNLLYNFEYFIDLTLCYTANTPDQSHLIKSRDKQAEKAAKIKEKAAIKAAADEKKKQQSKPVKKKNA